MIFKQLIIKNFRSYYGEENKFDFSDRLTLILGDNGDGKTTLFEALHWLFNTSQNRGELVNLSELCKSQMEEGDKVTVSVSLTFDHEGPKSVERSFDVERTGGGDRDFKVGNVICIGHETLGTERIQTDGNNLIKRCYDAFSQRFSMFKGESDLNVFNDSNALKDLVDKLSDIKKFDKLVEYSSKFEENAQKEYSKEMRSDRRTENAATVIEHEMMRARSDLNAVRAEIKEKNNSIEAYSSRLSLLEQNEDNSEKLLELNERIKSQREKENKLKAKIDEVNYNHALLDRMWILCAFPDILDEFKKKCSQLSKEKRRLEKIFNREKAYKLGQLNLLNDIQGALDNGATQLPWYLPDQETMEEMINDHICKVCGRPAEEGSDAYKFMVNKLEDFKRHLADEKAKKEKEKELSEQELFKFDNIDDLHNFSLTLSGQNERDVRTKAIEIHDRLGLVSRLTKELKDVREKIQDAQDDKTRLLIQMGNVSEDLLEKNYKDVKGLFDMRERANLRLSELNAQQNTLTARLNDLQKQMDDLNPGSSRSKTYRSIHQVMQEINKAFVSAQKENKKRLLVGLEDCANNYMRQLSVNDFHGEIRLIEKANSTTEIQLYSSNGSRVWNPSGSQTTVMYISVLFAISDFTESRRNGEYPLIFDAATSSFGDNKEGDFYNVIEKVDKQCIIITKDFINNGVIDLEGISKISSKVYRIKKADGYDQTNLATIRTTISQLQ